MMKIHLLSINVWLRVWQFGYGSPEQRLSDSSSLDDVSQGVVEGLHILWVETRQPPADVLWQCSATLSSSSVSVELFLLLLSIGLKV
jgi:hypothetical protein